MTPQQALNSGLAAGIAIFGARATKETIDIIQEYRKHDEDLKIPGFSPERAEPTILVTPAADQVSSSSWFPSTVDKGSIYPGAAPEVQKPIIFSGGIDYQDKKLLDDCITMEISKKTTENNTRIHAPSSGHLPAPRKFIKNLNGTPGTLPGFPESKYSGKTNDHRDKWILKDKTFATWDKRHGAVDLFNKTGKIHLGKYDPYTGKQLKDPKPERSSKP